MSLDHCGPLSIVEIGCCTGNCVSLHLFCVERSLWSTLIIKEQLFTCLERCFVRKTSDQSSLLLNVKSFILTIQHMQKLWHATNLESLHIVHFVPKCKKIFELDFFFLSLFILFFYFFQVVNLMKPIVAASSHVLGNKDVDKGEDFCRIADCM